jgi:enoyl-CoA hydratase
VYSGFDTTIFYPFYVLYNNRFNHLYTFFKIDKFKFIEQHNVVVNFEDIIVEKKENVAVITLNRDDKMNALSQNMRDELVDCFAQLESDDSVKCVVLTGGQNVFSAGFDLKEIITTNNQSFRRTGFKFQQSIYSFDKIIITAVGGYALAGGFDLVLAGDIIICASNAKFGHPEIKFGVNPSISMLWRKVGLSNAIKIALTGTIIDATEAYRIGLVSEITTVGTLVNRAIEIASEISMSSIETIRMIKQISHSLPGQSLRQSIDFEMKLFEELIDEKLMFKSVKDYGKTKFGKL